MTTGVHWNSGTAKKRRRNGDYVKFTQHDRKACRFVGNGFQNVTYIQAKNDADKDPYTAGIYDDCAQFERETVLLQLSVTAAVLLNPC